jgi:hypothetical protein
MKGKGNNKRCGCVSRETGYVKGGKGKKNENLKGRKR